MELSGSEAEGIGDMKKATAGGALSFFTTAINYTFPVISHCPCDGVFLN